MQSSCNGRYSKEEIAEFKAEPPLGLLWNRRGRKGIFNEDAFESVLLTKSYKTAAASQCSLAVDSTIS